eukprot:1157643-Pelagomonas_calceolata.AAC.3
MVRRNDCSANDRSGANIFQQTVTVCVGMQDPASKRSQVGMWRPCRYKRKGPPDTYLPSLASKILHPSTHGHCPQRTELPYER